MNTGRENANHDFLIGLVAGSVVGAGLAIICAPRLAAELRQRAMDSAAGIRKAATRGYRDVTGRVANVVDTVVDVADAVTAKGQATRDDVADAVGRGADAVGRGADAVGRGADAVGRGARKVEDFAKASKT